MTDLFSAAQVDLPRLILRAQQGDERALDTLLTRYRPYLRVVAERSLRPIFRSRFDGSDIAQQVCCDAFRGIGALRGTSETEFNAWLNRILQHHMANLRRDHTAARRDVRREQEINANSEILLQWCAGPPNGNGPESRVIKGEAALLLAQALTRLEPGQQTAIQMRYLETCTLVEIAEYLQLSTSSVARLIDRGLQALHRYLPEKIV